MAAMASKKAVRTERFMGLGWSVFRRMGFQHMHNQADQYFFLFRVGFGYQQAKEWILPNSYAV